MKEVKAPFIAHQRHSTKLEENLKDKQEKLKERKLNQTGSKIMTKLREDKQKKALRKT